MTDDGVPRHPVLKVTSQREHPKSANQPKKSINILILVSTLLFIFHQLITANQIFIFALIPILAGFFYDSQGHYSNVFLYIAIAGAIGSLLFILAKKPTHPSQRQKQHIE